LADDTPVPCAQCSAIHPNLPIRQHRDVVTNHVLVTIVDTGLATVIQNWLAAFSAWQDGAEDFKPNLEAAGDLSQLLHHEIMARTL